MWHCLCAYHIRSEKVYGLDKLVPYGSFFILCSFFSCTVFGFLRPNGKSVAFSEQIIIIFWDCRFHASVSADIYAGKISVLYAGFLIKYHLKAVKV